MKTFVRPSRRKNDTHLGKHLPSVNVDKIVGMIKIDPIERLLYIQDVIEHPGIEFLGLQRTWSFESEEERDLEWDLLMKKVCIP